MRPLTIISFERDLHSLSLALKMPHLFHHIRHGAPHALMAHGFWQSKHWPLRWELAHGDFQEKMEGALAPDIIFFDPFSPKTDTELWSANIFEKIFHLCRKRQTGLYTYSASTAVRAALLWAGFYVGPGARTGAKAETTVAYNYMNDHALFGQTWLERWSRSHAQFPPNLTDKARDQFQIRIQTHPQFQTGQDF